MNLLPNRSVLAIAVVVDVALHGDGANVMGKVMATRHGLPLRHLETTLQGLVRAHILTSVRGINGGYRLARESGAITAGEIVRASLELRAGATRSPLVEKVVAPTVLRLSEDLLAELENISVEALCAQAQAAHIPVRLPQRGEPAGRPRAAPTAAA